MDTADELVEQTRKALAQPMRLPHQASAIAFNLFLLLHVHRTGADPRVARLDQQFRKALADAGFEDLIGNQVDYAITLATSRGELLYEEMHKLFSLLGEIHALRTLGFVIDAARVQRLDDAVRARFAAEPEKARFVAKDKVDPWSRSLWWYRENLGGG
jgi:hypothetical protein